MSADRPFDKDEIWARQSAGQLEAYSQLSETELLALLEQGRFDLFMTLPEAVVAKLPKQRAVMAIFALMVQPAESYEQRHHLARSLFQLLELGGYESNAPRDALFRRVVFEHHGQQRRMLALAELWQIIKERFGDEVQAEFDLEYRPDRFLFSREVRFRLDPQRRARNTRFASSVEGLETAMRAGFARQQGRSIFFPQEARLQFTFADGQRVAILEDFAFPFCVALTYAGPKTNEAGEGAQGAVLHGSPAASRVSGEMPGTIHLLPGVLSMRLEGERSRALEDEFVSVASDPLGLFAFGYVLQRK